MYNFGLNPKSELLKAKCKTMSYDVEKVNPYYSNLSKKEQVLHMFDEIAPTYDKLNGLLSLGIDKYWRRAAIEELREDEPKTILDIATGTGDFAFLSLSKLQPERIIGIDISEGMLKVANEKAKERNVTDKITFEKQDATAMSFPDDTFNAVTVAFGIRNFEDIDAGFTEILRVLKPGGKFIFLELSNPEKPPFKNLYDFYEKKIIPTIGEMVSCNKEAYEYLPKSIKAFPQGREMMLILKKNGFVNIRMRRLTMGICSLYIAEKAL